MILAYLKLSFRRFTRQKFYSLLNIIGLATGMATVILIMLYVLDELSYDRFHRYEADLYRVVENQYYSGQPVFPVAVTPGPLANGLKEEFPEVMRATRVHYSWNAAFQYKESSFGTRGIYADEAFLSMFDFPLAKGDTATALDGINSIIVTPELSLRLFGDEDPMGKSIRVNSEREVIVTGVLEELPQNTHFKFDFIMPMSRRVIEIPSLKTEWGNNTLYTFVQLVPGASRMEFDAKIKGYVKTKLEASVTELFLQPVTDIHLSETSFVADAGRTGNKQYVRIFTVVAVFILIIACINFMNLSTARAMKRAREVGLRKAIGAYRYQLVFQFLGESVLVALTALCIALLFVDVLLSPFNTLTQKNLAIDFTSLTQGIVPICLVAALVTGLAAGSYPALFLSSFQPVNVLRGTLSGLAPAAAFRKILVVLQFSISIVMISGTIVIYSQMDYIRNMNLGWDRENVLMIQNIQNYPSLKERIASYSGIEGISATNQHPNYVMNSTSGIAWRGKSEDDILLFHLQGVDFDYIETMKMEMVMGRSFSKASPGDTLSTIINEEAMKLMGLENPLGEYLTAGDDEKYQIIGVVKNFHFKSIHDRIEPLLLYIDRYDLSNMMVRINGNTEGSVKFIEKEWKEVNPDQFFAYSFLDEDFDNLYKSEERTGIIFRYFSFLAILISCLGLFGLAAFTTEQKSKEYGIRKVFGASVSRLFYMASYEFLLLVLIAFVISVPVAWFWMTRWLEGFAYHIELSWLVFVVSGLLATAIALLTVSYQAGKVGTINPVKVLRMD